MFVQSHQTPASEPEGRGVDLWMRRQVSEKLLGRGGIIGRRYIGGTDADRERYARWVERWDAPDLARRTEIARALQGGPSDLVDRSKGFATFEPGRFAHTTEVVEAARAFLRDADPVRAKVAPAKPQLYTRLLPREEVTLDSPFLRFALQPAVLEAIAAYMGAVPILHDVDLWYSVSPNTDSFTNSQLYHCDWEGLTQVRLLVYVNEVKPTDGPFVVVEAERSKEVRERVGYTFFRDGADQYGRVPDEEVYAVVDEGQTHQLDGPEGTVVVVDTARCLHYGSRVERDASRTLFACQFLAPTSFVRPLRPDLRATYRSLATPALPELEALVLGA
ncbi:hypothetical protein [Rubrivirga marina]|uniref:Phytanoyl-CoA dioxygenase n=1 Tax=Rubrivirga marina TaxID=1196024 RepID=A0A271IZ46_9BACT|nr:hypothetical protein [Rubrivirga marina]PAP76493.1 hypothetical protein BSZ37_08590 [Rubrivirga marina]